MSKWDIDQAPLPHRILTMLHILKFGQVAEIRRVFI